VACCQGCHYRTHLTKPERVTGGLTMPAAERSYDTNEELGR